MIILFLPLGWLVVLLCQEYVESGSGLGANPDEALVRYLGEWSIRIFLIAYAITPISRVFHWARLARLRRASGLTAFTYVCLHFASYLFLFVELDWGLFKEDLSERAYIIFGMLALGCLSLMAFTSTRAWKKRLGVNWRVLHLIVHPAIVFAFLHYIWLTRDGFGVIVFYVSIFGVLFGERIYRVTTSGR